MNRLMQHLGKLCAIVTLSLVILATSAGNAAAQFPVYGGGGMAVGWGGFGYGYPMMGYGYGMGGYGYPMMGYGYGMGGYGYPMMGYGRRLRRRLWHGRLRIRLSCHRLWIRVWIWLSGILWGRLHASDVRSRIDPARNPELHDGDAALRPAFGALKRRAQIHRKNTK